MRALHEDASAALEPLRAALRAAAQAEADRIIGAAEDEVTAVLDAARAEADQIIASATAEGAATARAAAALHSARVRREAHELLLAEQESLRRELERRVVLAAQDLGGDPRHAAWLDRLTARCRQALGPRATVTPSPAGGVVGELGTRRLDLSVPVLAAAAVESHAAEVRQLWTT
jgi:cell division septum initiation protein DivIVA